MPQTVLTQPTKCAFVCRDENNGVLLLNKRLGK